MPRAIRTAETAAATETVAAETTTPTETPMTTETAAPATTPLALRIERAIAAADAAAAALRVRYPHILEIAEMGLTGPTRVRIRCLDPQTRQGVSVCTGSREIATQDLFQVRRCAACAKRAERIARRERTKAKDAELKAALRAMRAGQ